MSLLKLNGNAASPLTQFVSGIQGAMQEQGMNVSTPQIAKNVVSMENLDQGAVAELRTTAESVERVLRDAMGSLQQNVQASLGVESLSQTQIEAGMMIAMASADPAAYAAAALGNKARGGDGVRLVDASSGGVAGRLDFREEYSLEAFDNRELADMIPYSIAFNVQASRQDDFSEAFYPTVIVAPTNGGLDISIDHTSVFNAVKHKATGQTTDFNQRNLLDARSDYTILEDESTRLIPYINPDLSNADMFVDPALVSVSNYDVAGVTVPTAPLVAGKEIGLIGISNHPGLLGAGILDNTDALDTRPALENIYFGIDYDDGAGGIATDVIKFDVSRLPRSGFIDSIEGSGREETLSFRNDSLIINAATTNVDSTALGSTTLIATKDYSVRLGINITGTAHLEFGTVQVLGAPVNVIEIRDVDGNAISKDATDGLAIVQALAGMRLLGYTLNAARTNSNRRTRGLLLNNNTQTERFAIPLGAPISAPSPIGSDRDVRDLDSLITAARIRNSNNAVTTLLNYAETLQSYVATRRDTGTVIGIEGIARHVVNPFFEQFLLDMTAAMNSIRTKDRAEDVSATLINAIRDIAYRMYRDSHYQAALDAASMGNKKPTLLIGTDSVIQRHLMVDGDSRTFGTTFEDAKVVHTIDKRMANKIVITFTRESEAGTPDPLSFGTHAWMPELTSTMDINRDGATFREAMVQPRSRHINNLPIMAVIDVTNLTDVLVTKTP